MHEGQKTWAEMKLRNPKVQITEYRRLTYYGYVVVDQGDQHHICYVGDGHKTLTDVIGVFENEFDDIEDGYTMRYDPIQMNVEDLAEIIGNECEDRNRHSMRNIGNRFLERISNLDLTDQQKKNIVIAMGDSLFETDN